MSGSSAPQGINAQEEKELKRVFDHLCNYKERRKWEEKRGAASKRREHLLSHQKTPDEIKVVDKDGNQMSETQIEEELNRLSEIVDGCNQSLKKIKDDKEKQKIQKKDLAAALKSMGKLCTQAEIDYMVWEVDDNIDHCVDWDEFVGTFHRNVTDNTGLEPFQLFNIVQFMTYDKTCCGSVTVDDTMSMLYARFGRDQLETQMRKLFGDNASSADGGGSLTINDYLKAVSKREIKPKGLVECKRK